MKSLDKSHSTHKKCVCFGGMPKGQARTAAYLLDVGQPIWGPEAGPGARYADMRRCGGCENFRTGRKHFCPKMFPSRVGFEVCRCHIRGGPGGPNETSWKPWCGSGCSSTCPFGSQLCPKPYVVHYCLHSVQLFLALFYPVGEANWGMEVPAEANCAPSLTLSTFVCILVHCCWHYFYLVGEANWGMANRAPGVT